MKAYTDLQQSEKLAKILPIESADMFCADVCIKEKHSYNFYILSNWGYNTFEEMKEHENNYVHFMPCWSLSALVNVLPRIDIEKEIWSSDKYDYRVKAFIGDGYVGDWYDNPVDACVEMIVKLKETNQL